MNWIASREDPLARVNAQPHLKGRYPICFMTEHPPKRVIESHISRTLFLGLSSASLDKEKVLCYSICANFHKSAVLMGGIVHPGEEGQ